MNNSIIDHKNTLHFHFDSQLQQILKLKFILKPPFHHSINPAHLSQIKALDSFITLFHFNHRKGPNSQSGDESVFTKFPSQFYISKIHEALSTSPIFIITITQP
ncbi:unnamed protein product [Lathyrus oleraceus]